MLETAKKESPQAIVIGTGFAGAVTACRLTEAGLRVCVLERGRRYLEQHFPVFPEADIPSAEPGSGTKQPPTPDPGLLLWSMNHGMWDLRNLGEIIVAQAAGYGGGSLFYANVHLRPPPEVFAEGWPKDPHPYNKKDLDPYFDLAAYMLDVKPYPKKAPELAKTRQLEKAAEKLGRKCFRPPLAVNFHPPKYGRKENRFGKEQGRCKLRGDCCFGCAEMAKNTLDLNYLARAEDPEDEDRTPAEIHELSEVLWIGSRKDGSYQVGYRDLKKDELKTVEAPYVFLCAGAVNSTELLLKSRIAKNLPCPGPEQGLGQGFYPNADSIAVAFDCNGLQEADRGPTITSALLYEDGNHWFLFQDGGMPTDLEPFLGVFRSPLWLGRNRFWEGSAPPPSARAPRIGFATLPFQSMGDVLSDWSSGSPHWRSPLLREIAGALEEIGRGLRSPEWLAEAEGGDSTQADKKRSQIVKALEASRDQLLEALVFAVEPFVTGFLDRTAERVEERVKLKELLKEIPLSKDLGLGDIDDVDLAQRLLRLGAQLGWGSQGGMIREVAVQLLEFVMPDRPETVEHATDLLRWMLDFRMTDSRTGMILCMGRDSDPPARLSIEIPEPPPIGSTVTGREPEKKGKRGAEDESSREEDSDTEETQIATGILLSLELDSGSWALNDAAGTLTLARLSGRFEGKHLFVGDRLIGVVEKESELHQRIPVLSQGAPTSPGEGAREEAQPPKLFEILFKPPASTRQQQAVALRSLLGARLHAQLPQPTKKPDWSTQERMLRDIVNRCWEGELRTDPISTFMRRRLTVHPQGGCPMGLVTEPDGQVKDCKNLYVMDAAAFPRSVGVNPSATILAIAEYKVERFLRGYRGKPQWQACDFVDARNWMNEPGEQRRKQLDPLGGAHAPGDPPETKPVGIRFKEKMTGHCGRTEEDRDHRIKVELEAKIEDLAWFLELHRRGQTPPIAVGGKAWLTDPTGTEEKLNVRFSKQSCIRLFQKAGGPGAGGDTRLIEYELYLESESGSSYLITGKKTIQDDVGDFDLWADVRTLKFEMEKNGKPFVKGALEVPAAEFFGDQLNSFEATGTTDPVRQIWALTAFGKLFFGHLLDVYLPELETLGEAAKCIAEHTHG